jgi:flagellar FliL protein
MAKDKDADKNKSKTDGEGPEGGAEGDTPAKPKSRFAFLFAKKTLMFVVAPVLLLLIGGGAYFFLFMGGEEATAEGEAGAHGEASVHGEAGAHGADEAHPVFFEVPDIMVNVATNGAKPAFLKLAISLEVEGTQEEATAQLEPIVPRIVDQLQTYLRELRVEDLSGSAAMFRLKEEMIRRVNLSVEPIKVKNVLFREMIIQ